jgi:hypothetical protein
MGQRSRIKRVRRAAITTVKALPAEERLIAVNQLLDHRIINPKKGRELLEMRRPVQQRNNLPDQ